MFSSSRQRNNRGNFVLFWEICFTSQDRESPVRCDRDGNRAPKIGHDEGSIRNGFSILTTIESILMVKFTNPANEGFLTFNLNKLWITSYELLATIQTTIYKSYNLWSISYELWATIWDIKSRLRRMTTVWFVTWLYGEESYRTLVEFISTCWWL